ncbi:hypothetical protein NM208_g9787 [Fusarium decemcellulare]|uniref:Uncharacterized protein n=1 Tax=Fusarium decemcellulare TaxID=57161 RepID=A0ACC1S081_9HYPO|nr:hypothetical protein NM208_g9787 [Fusarium decemcellulare]
MFLTRLAGIVAVFTTLQIPVAAIEACPSTERPWTSSRGLRYSFCSGSDYQGPSLQITPDVASTQACAQICSQSPVCSKAVYDKRDRQCHIKNIATELAWAVDDRFDAIHLSEKLRLGAFISKCPGTEATYTSPSKLKFRVCRNTDFVGASAKMVNQVTSLRACAELCSREKGCEKAVFDHINNVCHIKAAEPAASIFWVTSNQFDIVYKPKTPNRGKQGQWSDIIRFEVIPVAAYVVPKFPQSERLLFFSAWGVDAFSGASGRTQFGAYNFVTKQTSHREIANTKHDMFCPGMSTLADGRILISGGADAEAVSFYHPDTNTFTRGKDMQIARGYQSSTTLSNGKVFVIGGAYSGPREGKNGEVYDPATDRWTLLPSADVKPMLTTDHEGIWREDNHAWLFGWKRGSVFQAGPSTNQHWYGTTGKGSVAQAGKRDGDDAMCGIFVMYNAIQGKILSAGGSPDYTDSPATNRAHITTIGEPNRPSKVERVGDMAFPRGFANAVVLPDGTVFVSGGQRRSLVFTNTDGILVPELFNPATKQWTALAPMAVPRNYHSVSLLLPDGTVFSGGGGLCFVAKIGASSAGCDKTVDHADGEIYKPPYLFNADGTIATRPVLQNLQKNSVKVGGKLVFQVSGITGRAKIALVRMGSVTHSVNTDQRRVPLTNLNVSGSTYTAALPTDSGILLPGYYYLFAISPNGTPSIAQTVHVSL